jgi:hypothetical protein
MARRGGGDEMDRAEAGVEAEAGRGQGRGSKSDYGDDLDLVYFQALWEKCGSGRDGEWMGADELGT